MNWLLVVATLWSALASALAIGVGRSIRLADARATGPWASDLEQSARQSRS